MSIDAERAQALLDKQAIYEVVARYARGIDRFDWDLVRSCFHEGAMDEHGVFTGPIEAFIPWVREELGKMTLSQHLITNPLIDLDGDRAQSETYVTAYHRLPPKGEGEPDRDFVVGARWIDRFERREGTWRIGHRRVVWEWSTATPVGRQWNFNENYRKGRRDKQDPVYDRPRFASDWAPPTTIEGRLQELLDKKAIAEVVQRYCRGVDRIDMELVRSCYHPDATDDHGTYQGDRDGFVQHAGDGLTTMLGTMHYIGNRLVDVQGDVAYSEAYCVAYHRMPSRKSGKTEQLVACRYVDRFERRDGAEWKLGDRMVAYEWSRIDPISQELELSPEWMRGQRNKDDLAYARSGADR